MSNPAVHLPHLIEHARHHITRSRNRLGVQAYDAVLDEIVAALPDVLPIFVPQTDRWRTEKIYRTVRRHLRKTFEDFYKEFGLWKERAKASEEDDDE